MSKAPKVISTDVVSAIFDKHSGPEWVRFAEVSSSTGYDRGRRVDAICMNIWPSKGYAIHGYEVKVTRADFIQEMKDISKAEAIGQYCDYWWLATPVGLIDVNEVPEKWGLIELCKNGMRIKKQAPKKDVPSTLPRDFMASMLRKSRDQDDRYILGQVQAQNAIIKDKLEREYRQKIEQQGGQTLKNSEWIEQFEAKLGIPFRSFETPDKIAERLKIAQSMDFGNISRLSQVCEGVIKEVSNLKQVSSELVKSED